LHGAGLRVPELPEVETVRRGLAPVLVGRRIARVEARRPDLRFPLPEAFTTRLSGAVVHTLDRRAKYLLAGLDTGETLIAHLGMSGRFTIHPVADRRSTPGAFHHDASREEAHTHIVFETECGDRITYSDPRRFGFMDLVATSELAGHRSLRDLGPEPLGPDFGAGGLSRALNGSRQPIKAALLDQTIVAGLGNIYVCEALHRAGISPMRRAGRISATRIANLAEAIRLVLEEAILAGGSTLRDFADAQGELGYFQHSFRVYDRAGEGCPRAGCDGVVLRRVQSGRSSYFCSHCQT
jgi:formamidopyrimidine-DNA glycosylase